jgi:toxin-antitoxin system PIN domain toxin
MRALLDVNVLIALLDADHVSHAKALEWFGAEAGKGWASCPLTQNGCVRIMSHPGYPSPLPVAAVAQRLRLATGTSHHEFWPDAFSILDASIVDSGRIHGPRQLTDVYLLALAVLRGGRFVTFDAGIALSAVKGATPAHLITL